VSVAVTLNITRHELFCQLLKRWQCHAAGSCCAVTSQPASLRAMINWKVCRFQCPRARDSPDHKSGHSEIFSFENPSAYQRPCDNGHGKESSHSVHTFT